MKMCSFESLMVVFVIAVLVSTSYAVIKTAESTRELVYQTKTKTINHLPSECEKYYNSDRHEEWADCMGVGYVN